MDFGYALVRMKNGQKLTRKGWNGKGKWVALQVPDEYSKMKRPYFYIHPVDGNLVPWVPSVSDCLAEHVRRNFDMFKLLQTSNSSNE